MSVRYVKSDDVYRRHGYEYDDKGTIKRGFLYLLNENYKIIIFVN